MRTIRPQTWVLAAALGIVSCGRAGISSHPSGGTTGVGPASQGGSAGSAVGTGGNSAQPTGGAVAAGNGEAGNTGNAGTSLGGAMATGGSNLGSAGSTVVGTAATGGTSATGGGALDGAATGGGLRTGGAATAGVATGGVAATGGAATGGASTATSDSCAAAAPLSGGTPHCHENSSGSYGSYTWQLWSNMTTGCLTTYDGGAFSAAWNNSGNLLAFVGLRLDGTKTYQELGTFSADFAETKTGTAASYSYIGAYGRSVEPFVEFYIVEDSFNSPPPPPSANSKPLGTVAADGGTYDVYKSQLVSTETTIYRFFSIRRTTRHCGHISISEHFSKWAELGMQLGKLHEVDILVESGGGTGSIDFTTVSVVVE